MSAQMAQAGYDVGEMEEAPAEEEVLVTPVNQPDTLDVSNEAVTDDAKAKDAPYELENKE